MVHVESADSSVPSPYEQHFSDDYLMSPGLHFSPPPSVVASSLIVADQQMEDSDSSVPSAYGGE